MSTARALANHSLYLARIQLDSWRRQRQEEDIAALTLTQAFLPAARAHLLDAYGYFLLDIIGAEPPPGEPPHACDQLPETAAGQAVPAEIREFRQLENRSWLAQLLAEPDLRSGVSRAQGSLASSSPDLPDCEDVHSWAVSLEALFDRMGDALDEY